MKVGDLNVTETRVTFLGKIKSGRDWERADGEARNTRSGKKIPEPTYLWLVENDLVRTDGANIFITDKGRDILTR